MIPFVTNAYAAVDATALGRALDPIIYNVVNPIIELMFAVGVVVFAYGIFEMVIRGGDASAREKGSQHVLYGVIGMFIMMAAWGIVYVIANTVKAF